MSTTPAYHLKVYHPQFSPYFDLFDSHLAFPNVPIDRSFFRPTANPPPIDTFLLSFSSSPPPLRLFFLFQPFFNSLAGLLLFRSYGVLLDFLN